MKVTALLFAGYREAVGTSSVDLELAEGATLGDLADLMSNRYPGLPGDSSRIVGAVNEEYQRHDHLLAEGDEVALIPPVSGGCSGGSPERAHIR